MPRVEFSIRESLFKDTNFKIIKNKVNVVDIPGIDDGPLALKI